MYVPYICSMQMVYFALTDIKGCDWMYNTFFCDNDNDHENILFYYKVSTNLNNNLH